jgi:hypothetical protein
MGAKRVPNLAERTLIVHMRAVNGRTLAQIRDKLAEFERPPSIGLLHRWVTSDLGAEIAERMASTRAPSK